MSYILDALRKSDQLRQRGATPTLATVPLPAPSPGRPRYLLSGALAAALIGAGALLGWLQPWRASPPAAPPIADAPRVASASPAVVAQTTAPSQPSASPSEPGSAPQAAEPAARPPAQQEAAAGAAGGLEDSAIAGPQHGTASGGTAARGGQDVPLLNDLPADVRQEVPAISIAFHAYSGNARERRVMINGDMAQEGEPLAGGLSLEQITPDGVILGYKGYRFRQPVR